MIPHEALKPVVNTRAYIQIANQITDAVRQGVFKPGGKLPPERVLAERLHVSRTSVREALSALEIIGLVECRTGNGTYIRKHPAEIPLLNTLFAELSEREGSPQEVLEARNVIEPATTRFAAERATPEDLVCMEAALAAMGEAMMTGQSYIPHDVDFHLAIATASGNSILAQNVSSLVTAMHSKLWDNFNAKTRRTPGQREHLLQEHRRVFEAIRSKDADSAAAAMAVHLAEATKFFFAE